MSSRTLGIVGAAALCEETRVFDDGTVFGRIGGCLDDRRYREMRPVGEAGA